MASLMVRFVMRVENLFFVINTFFIRYAGFEKQNKTQKTKENSWFLSV